MIINRSMAFLLIKQNQTTIAKETSSDENELY